MLKHHLAGVILFLAAAEVANAQTNFQFFEPVNPPRAVQVIVHRGMSNAAPENSARAIEICAEDFCEWAEIDVRLTKDGHHVIIHDATVDSTTDGNGKVAELTLEELKKLDAGSWFAKRFTGSRILTLAEALTIAKGKINLYLDCKRVDPQRLVDDIVAAGMQQQVVVYDNIDHLLKVKAVSNGSVAGMTKYRPSMPFAAFVKDVAPTAVEIDADDVTPELCQSFHQAGIKVQAKVLGEKWDRADVWTRMIESGVDWLQTDDPAGIRFLDVRRRLGKFPVMIACHRGVNRYAPENTIPAIQHAARIGIDFVEIDIHTTKDGQTVLIHDRSLSRTTNGTGNVRDQFYDELRSLSAGAWFGKPFAESRIPLLEEGLPEYGTVMSAYLDAKDIAPEALLAAIHKFGFVDRHVVYQSVKYCERLKQLDPNVRTMPPLARVEQLDAVAATKPYALDTSWGILSASLIADCHKRGIKVFSDALGRNETLEQYTYAIEWGIDCIQTDHPLRVLRAIELLKRE